MSVSPIIRDSEIIIPKASSVRTAKDNVYYVLDDKDVLFALTAEKRIQVINITPEMRFLVHIYRTTRDNYYVTVYDLETRNEVISFSTLDRLDEILGKLSKVPPHVRKLIFKEIGIVERW